VLKLRQDLPAQTAVISCTSLDACLRRRHDAVCAVRSRLGGDMFHFLSWVTIFFVSSSMSISLRGLKGRGMFYMGHTQSRISSATLHATEAI